MHSKVIVMLRGLRGYVEFGNWEKTCFVNEDYIDFLFWVKN